MNCWYYCLYLFNLWEDLGVCESTKPFFLCIFVKYHEQVQQKYTSPTVHIFVLYRFINLLNQKVDVTHKIISIVVAFPPFWLVATAMPLNRWAKFTLHQTFQSFKLYFFFHSNCESNIKVNYIFKKKKKIISHLKFNFKYYHSYCSTNCICKNKIY